MGKKKDASSSLGRSLIKDRFGGSKDRKFVANNSMLHTTEIQDGYDWGRLNLQSVTEESSFQEFLSTAELAGTEFQAEKLNIKFVNPRSNVGLLGESEKRKAEEAHNKNRGSVTIPRRPEWDSKTTAEELQEKEKEKFLEWRRSLAKLQEDEGVLLTPYEKNLEFWRQLWRVVERSDVVVQIVDARNPLLFRCEDLEKYVLEVSKNKMNLILINKADFLTEEQRKHWADYFSALQMRVVFFSAVLAAEKEKPEESESEINLDEIKEGIQKLDAAVNETAQKLTEITKNIPEIAGSSRADEDTQVQNTSELLTREKLIDLFETVHTGPKVTEGITTVGLVGYPNVGKSSTINALLWAKKVSVSATPGKTKHFQTLYLTKTVLLCDCPGLVMPSFVFTKAEMIVNGILPVDQMRDHVPPVNLVASLIPRHVLEDTYGIMIPRPMEGEDPDRCPFAEEVLNAYAFNRGFMTANGQPDNPRAARYVLKDFINGKLLYAHAPPGIEQTVYHTWPERQRNRSANSVLPPREARAINANHVTTEELDRNFFRNNSYGVHTKGIAKITNSGQASASGEKPWKKINKHQNKNKKEKLRRVYAHLDQH